MKKGQFLLVCVYCYEKYKSWDKALLTSIHLDPLGYSILRCSNCGAEQIIIPSQKEKHTKKSVIEDKKKQIIAQQLIYKGGTKN